ncbi:MAG TPA: hypothetical protein VJP76_03140, partial [Candidatus Tumulicola sp.]|nr:hypothetical protein [Candidatus Tumulicola sp.]
SAVEGVYGKTKRLPATVPPIAGDAARDPATHEAYAYTPARDSHYTLCATFESADNDALGDDFWKHPAGRRCFSLDATQSPG